MQKYLKKVSMALALPAVVALPALVPTGCDHEDDNLVTARSAEVTDEIEDIKEEPGRYFGQTVKLIGEVDDVYGQRSFELEGLDLIFGEEVLVLTKSPIALGHRALQDDALVRVRGTVKKYSSAELEKELGWKLEDEVQGVWEGKPVIVATAIDAVREYARWSEENAQKGEIVGFYAFYTAPLQERSTLQDMSVTFEDTRVNQVNNGKLWVGWSHPGVMVVPAGGLSVEGIQPGDFVDIQGRFVSASSAQNIKGIDRLARAEKMALQQDGVYVEAASIAEVEHERTTEDLTSGATEPADGVSPTATKPEPKAGNSTEEGKAATEEGNAADEEGKSSSKRNTQTAKPASKASEQG